MTTSGLASIEYKPQDQQTLHGGEKIWSHKKLKLSFILYVEMIFILYIIYSVNALFMFFLCFFYWETVYESTRVSIGLSCILGGGGGGLWGHY